MCPSTITGGKMEVIRKKLIREVLDIFNIRLFCKKNQLFKVFNQLYRFMLKKKDDLQIQFDT